MVSQGANKENSYSTLWLKEDILYFKYKANAFIDLPGARTVVQDRIQIQKAKSMPVLCLIEGNVGSDKAARDYFASNDPIFTKAVAYVIDPPIAKDIVEFYIRRNEYSVPSKIFTNELEAQNFLKQYVT